MTLGTELKIKAAGNVGLAPAHPNTNLFVYTGENSGFTIHNPYCSIFAEVTHKDEYVQYELLLGGCTKKDVIIEEVIDRDFMKIYVSLTKKSKRAFFNEHSRFEEGFSLKNYKKDIEVKMNNGLLLLKIYKLHPIIRTKLEIN